MAIAYSSAPISSKIYAQQENFHVKYMFLRCLTSVLLYPSNNMDPQEFLFFSKFFLTF